MKFAPSPSQQAACFCSTQLFFWVFVAAFSTAQAIAQPAQEQTQTPPILCQPCESFQLGQSEIQSSRNPLVEFIWRIAATDSLFDPEQLFSKTLGVGNPPKAQILPWGLQAGLRNQSHWPIGTTGTHYMLVIPVNSEKTGHRYLSFQLDSKQNCIQLDDVFTTFGKEYWHMPPQIVAPYSAQELSSAALKRDHNIYGLKFKSPRLFQGNDLSSVQFRFEYSKCANEVTLYHPLDLVIYNRFKREAAK